VEKLTINLGLITEHLSVRHPPGPLNLPSPGTMYLSYAPLLGPASKPLHTGGGAFVEGKYLLNLASLRKFGACCGEYGVYGRQLVAVKSPATWY